MTRRCSRRPSRGSRRATAAAAARSRRPRTCPPRRAARPARPQTPCRTRRPRPRGPPRARTRPPRPSPRPSPPPAPRASSHARPRTAPPCASQTPGVHSVACTSVGLLVCERETCVGSCKKALGGLTDAPGIVLTALTAARMSENTAWIHACTSWLVRSCVGLFSSPDSLIPLTQKPKQEKKNNKKKTQ